MDIKLKKAKKRNFKEMSKIYIKAFSEPPYNEKWTKKQGLTKIKLFSKYCEIWEILYKKQLIGFIIINSNFWLPGKFCFVEDIAIKKEFRGKGIGTIVLKKIMKRYKEKGFEYFLGLANKQSKAFKLYNKLGIKENKVDKLISKELK